MELVCPEICVKWAKLVNMALIKLSGFLGDLRGKIAGSVFALTGSGLVMKRKPNPVNKNTEKQSLRRSFASLLQQEWFLLTAQQRQCWNTWSALNPIKQQNFTGLFINAQQTFIKLNYYRLLYNLAIIKSPVFNKALNTPVSGSLSLVSGNLILTMDRSINDSTEFIILLLTKSLPLTINNPGNLYRAIVFTTTGTDTFDVSSPYFDIFGRLPVSGEKVFMKITTADKITGLVFPFQVKSFVFP